MGHRILIIGEYLDQLKQIAKMTGLPVVTGKTSQSERDRLYEQFRAGSITGLILSRVGNFALDLPDADVLIQVSGIIRLTAGRGAEARASAATESGWS